MTFRKTKQLRRTCTQAAAQRTTAKSYAWSLMPFLASTAENSKKTPRVEKRLMVAKVAQKWRRRHRSNTIGISRVCFTRDIVRAVKQKRRTDKSTNNLWIWRHGAKPPWAVLSQANIPAVRPMLRSCETSKKQQTRKGFLSRDTVV